VTGDFRLHEHPHRRFNPLTGEWVLVSPHRMLRPWQGQVEAAEMDRRPRYDPACYLCPGNERAGGERNPAYEDVFVFDNDFAALRPDTPAGELDEGGLLLARAESGLCRVVCFSPRHDLTLAGMEAAAIGRVVDLWVAQYQELGARPDIGHVQIFENRGAMMGCSNPHPHGQIWAQRSVPLEVSQEGTRFGVHYAKSGRTLLEEYADLERAAGERVVLEQGSFLVVVPFWAVWPFETLVLPSRPVASLLELTSEERVDLAWTLRRLSTRYDNLFQTTFPYSAGVHQAPTDGSDTAGWHLHLHFHPPLLRSATVRKFMVGYEMLAEPQRDLTPEAAAARLRGQPDRHYTERSSAPSPGSEGANPDGDGGE
jgi:UDPglucose--hexose-1-phosphate uridylyltransferase